MSVMSFAHLKPSGQGQQGQAAEEPVAEKPAAEQPGPVAEQPAAEQSWPDAPRPWPGTKPGPPNPNDGLISSGYCFGCSRLSIDAPGNPDHEARWCCRENPPGSYYQWTFRRIKEGVKVKQCPKRANKKKQE